MKKVSLVLSGIMFSGAVAVAEPMKETGGYLGLSYGFTELDDDDYYDGGKDDEDNLINIELDDKDRAWQIFGGYRFMKYFALEARYTNFGEYEAEFDENIVINYMGFPYEVRLSAKDKAKFSALSAHAVGIYPFGQSGFDIYGQLGLGLMWYAFESSIYLDGEDLGDEDEDGNSAVLSGGLGIRYTPPSFQAITIQLGYDVYRFNVELEEDDLNPSLSMGKLGIQYNF